MKKITATGILLTSQLLLIAQAQYVGINMTNPTAPLSFPNTGGNKILFSGNGSQPHYGMGLVGLPATNLAFYAPDANSGINFSLGYGYPSRKDLYITNDNNVKFGSQIVFAQNNGYSAFLEPANTGKLNILGPMRLRVDNLYESAGIWYSSADGTSMPLFIGMNDNEMWRIYGNSGTPGNRFGVNLVHGSLFINGSYGGGGQLLTSKGGTQPAMWADGPFLKVYNGCKEQNQNFALTVNTTANTTIPGISISYNFAENNKLRVFYNVMAEAPACVFCGATDFIISLVVNGNVVKSFQHYIENNTVNSYHGSFWLSLSAGVQNLSLVIKKIAGPDIVIPAFGDNKSSMVVEVTPVN